MSAPGVRVNGVSPSVIGRMAAAGRSGQLRRFGGRAGWTFADQGLSSLTNAVLSIVVARAVDAAAFGAFAVVLLTFSFAVGISRAVVTDALVVRFSGEADERWRAAAGAAAGAAAWVGVVAAVLAGAAALLLPPSTGAPLAVLALLLPGLLVQDAWRFAFFAGGRPARATVNDLVWTVLQLSGIGALLLVGLADVRWFVAAWGGAAVVAAIVGCVQTGTRPRMRAGLSWFREHRDLSSRIGTEYAVNMGAVNLAYYLVGVVAGLVALGALRAAQTLLGPLQLAFAAVTALVLPIMSSMSRARRRVLAVAVAASVLTALVAVAWMTVLLLLPASVGVELLGDSWQGARAVMLPAGLMLVAVGASSGAALAAKAVGRPGLLVRTTLVQAPLLLGLGVSGGVVAGAVGAAWGFAAGQVVGSSLLWVLLLVELSPLRSRGRHVRGRATLSYLDEPGARARGLRL